MTMQLRHACMLMETGMQTTKGMSPYCLPTYIHTGLLQWSLMQPQALCGTMPQCACQHLRPRAPPRFKRNPVPCFTKASQPPSMLCSTAQSTLASPLSPTHNHAHPVQTPCQGGVTPQEAPSRTNRMCKTYNTTYHQLAPTLSIQCT
jgi:hypothetical protein